MQNDTMLAVAVRAARRAASVMEDAARDLKRLPSHSNGVVTKARRSAARPPWPRLWSVRSRRQAATADTSIATFRLFTLRPPATERRARR